MTTFRVLLLLLPLVTATLSVQGMFINFSNAGQGSSDGFRNYNFRIEGQLWFPDVPTDADYRGSVVLQHLTITPYGGMDTFQGPGLMPRRTGEWVAPQINDLYVGESTPNAFASYIWSGDGRRYSQFTRSDTGLSFTDRFGGQWHITPLYADQGNMMVLGVPDIYLWSGLIRIDLFKELTLPGGSRMGGGSSVPDTINTYCLAIPILLIIAHGFYRPRTRGSYCIV